MKKHLIPMTDFVLNLDNNDLNEKKIESIFNYANFLKQPVKIEMFIPCDDDGNVLEIPQYKSNEEKVEQEFLEYQKAKEKVLFEGFEYFKVEKNGFLVKNKETNYIVFFHKKRKQTLELLQYAKLELIETAIKQIYGC